MQPRIGRTGRGRSIGGAEHRSRTVLSRGVRVLAVACIVALANGPVAAHAQSSSANTEGSIEKTRAAIDDIAQDWFSTQHDADQLDSDIADLEVQVAAAREHAERTADVARERALVIYMGTGGSIGSVLDGVDALDSARRVELLDRASAESHRAIEELEDASQNFDEQRESLERQRTEQAQVADQLQSQRSALEAELATLQAQAREAAAAAPSASSPRAARPATSTDAPLPTVTPPPPAVQGGEHPHHNDPFLVCTRSRESGGQYGVVSASGLYHGAYQFAPTTWNATASHAGRPDLVGVLPSQASPWDQDDLAWTLYQWQGKRPWGGRC